MDFRASNKHRERTVRTAARIPAYRNLARRTAAIIVNYDAGPKLADCLQSVIATAPEVQVVLVANGPADPWPERLASQHTQVDLVRPGQNLGYGAANNLGVEHTDREFLVFLNPDTLVHDGWLEALLAELDSHPSVGLVTPKIVLRSDPDSINAAGLNVHLSGLSMCRGEGHPSEEFGQAADVAAVSGAAFAARKKVFLELGGFDPDLFLYMEDVDLSLRSWLAGYRCRYLPEALVEHDYAFRLDPQKTYYVERGRYLLLLKIFRIWTLLRMLPLLLLVEVITWGWVVVKRPRAVGQKLRALWSLKEWDRVRAKRARVQGDRRVSDETLIAQLRTRLPFAQLAGPLLARLSSSVFNPLLALCSIFLPGGAS